jgi:hypothetical protein
MRPVTRYFTSNPAETRARLARRQSDFGFECTPVQSATATFLRLRFMRVSLGRNVLRERTKVAPQAVRVPIRKETLDLKVGTLPNRNGTD